MKLHEMKSLNFERRGVSFFLDQTGRPAASGGAEP
jgi:hypothetical protein